VDRDHVGGAQDGVQRAELQSHLASALDAEERVVCDDAHPERTRSAGDLGADSPRAEQCERLPVQLRAVEAITVPPARTHRAVRS
jgi:hypothetical protein